MTDIPAMSADIASMPTPVDHTAPNMSADARPPMSRAAVTTLDRALTATRGGSGSSAGGWRAAG